MFTVYIRRFGRWTPSATTSRESYAYRLLREAALPTVITDAHGTPLAANCPQGFNYQTERNAA